MRVSVISPTWQRHQLLLERCIPSVRAQTMPVEHVIASDGPDPELRELLAGLDVVYIEVPVHNTEGHLVGGWARNQGLEAATGDLIAYLDDDNAFRPNHIEMLYAVMAESSYDFAYSMMERHGLGDFVGSEPPAYGCIDSSIIMHRRDVPERLGRWAAPSEYHIDWQLIGGWLERGATWVHVPKVTVDYYVKGT